MFLNIKKKIILNRRWQSLIACLLFLFITILASYKILPSSGIITYGDGAYFHNINLQWENITTTLSPNYLGQNQSSSVWNYLPEVFIIFFFKIFGLSNNIIAYLLSFGLFLLTAIIYYYIFYKISKNFYFGILAGLLIILNNLTIEHIAFGGFLYYFLSLISFALLFSLLWKLNINKGILSGKSIILIILSSLLSYHPFYFIIYLILIFLFFSFYAWQYRKLNEISKYIITLLSILLASSYWELPFLYNLLNMQPGDVYGAINLNNVFLGYLKVSSFLSAIDFFQYFNFFSRNFHQTIIHYIFYIGIIFLLLLSIVSVKISKNKSFLLFLLVLYILFFNLSLGPISKIFGPTWLWFWHNVSFFSFFRSFSRFLIIIIPIFILYFAIYNLDWKYKYKNYIYTILGLFIIFLNFKVLTGDLNGNILATKIPAEYEKINYIIKEDKSDNNIISFPNASYEAYDWGINNNTNLIQQNYFLKDYLFIKPIIYERASLNLNHLNKTFANIFLPNCFNNFDSNLKNINIGYILIQKDLINIFNLNNKDNKNFNKIRYEEYENYFSNNSNYTFLEGNRYFSLYKNNLKTKTILSDGSLFKKINSTKYRIYLRNITKEQTMLFLQNYSNYWNVFINKNISTTFCEISNEYTAANNNYVECKHEQKFFEGDELSYLYKKPIFDDTHQLVYDYANQWTIDPNYIKQNFSKDYYKENPDGSIDIELTLYFKPQSYFYLGLIISGTTLISCLGYLGWDFLKRRKKKI